MTDRSDRNSAGGARSFASHKSPSPKHLSAAERRRLEAQRDREEIAELVETQRRMRADAYRRLFGTTPPEESAA